MNPSYFFIAIAIKKIETCATKYEIGSTDFFIINKAIKISNVHIYTEEYTHSNTCNIFSF